MNKLQKLIERFSKTYIGSKVMLLTQFTFIRYILVGCTNTAVCFVSMYIAYLMGFHYLTYTAIGYLVAIFYSFFMNLHFTFRVEGKIAKRLTLFFVINLSNLGVVEIIEYVMIDIFHINRLVAIFSAMTWYVITGFLMNNYLVYNRKLM